MAHTLATERDQRHLLRAVDLASSALGRTSPNPLVGAVIVKDGHVIGEGFHAAAGEPHAERVALAAVDGDTAGATMYVSLEPCCHHGRTPPCTAAILEAGIARVVIASDDPTPKASGRGLGMLRDEGVAVEVADGEAARRARLLNQPFRKHARTGMPLVVFKSAMTLDGKVATRTGDSKWISSDESRERVHRWRAQADAVAVGIGTAEADDPLLTARIESAPRQPRRVVFDSEARLSLKSQLVRGAADVPVTVVCSHAADRAAREALAAADVDVIVVPGASEAERVRAALAELGERGVQCLLLEGGPHLAGAFADAGEIDEARIFVSPLIAGGREAKDAVEGQGVARIEAARRAAATEVERIGHDVLITARMREW